MPPLPQALPNFEHIKRFWSPKWGMSVAQILPGEVYVTKQHEMVSTLLGSCIAVCMRDKVNKVGGMNHFKLPLPAKDHSDTTNANYGIYAMELLINAILKNGGDKKNLECTIYGGGNVSSALTSDIGGKNVEFVLCFVRKESIPIIHQDTNHRAAQQVYFHPVSGNTFSMVREEDALEKIKQEEEKYLACINNEITKPNIDFF